MIVAPLFHDKNAVGVLKILSKEAKAFNDQDVQTLQLMAAFFSKLLFAAIDRTERSAKLFALFFLDVDHFKKINDTLGHDIGDELLKAFAGRIKLCIRKSDIAGRLGGDEFVILLDDIPNQDAAISVANSIIEKMQAKFSCKEKTFNITTSIGITFFDNRKNADELLKEADTALYNAKNAGKNTYKIFESH